MSNEVQKRGGIGLCGAIFLVFLVLKLIGKISWSWWWITAPLWGPTALVVAIMIICGIIVVAASSNK